MQSEIEDPTPSLGDLVNPVVSKIRQRMTARSRRPYEGHSQKQIDAAAKLRDRMCGERDD